MTKCNSCGKVIQDEDSVVKVDGMAYHQECAEELGLLPGQMLNLMDDLVESDDAEDVETVEDVPEEEPSEDCDDDPGFDDPEDAVYECAECHELKDGSLEEGMTFLEGRRVCPDCYDRKHIEPPVETRLADMDEPSIRRLDGSEEEGEIAHQPDIGEDTYYCPRCNNPIFDTEESVEHEGQRICLDCKAAIDREEQECSRWLADLERDLVNVGADSVMEMVNSRRRTYLDMMGFLENSSDTDGIERIETSNRAYTDALEIHLKAHPEEYAQYTLDADGYYVRPKDEPKDEPQEEPKEEEPKKSRFGLKRPNIKKPNLNAKLPRRNAKGESAPKQEREYDVDSFHERYRRWQLIHKKGYVILKTLTRDPKREEYLLETTLIPRSELPEDAVAVTEEANTYCVDGIKNTEWYAESRAEIEATQSWYQRQFTASDAMLYMTSNKIDNALAIKWQTSVVKNDMKTIFVIVGVLAVALVLIMRFMQG